MVKSLNHIWDLLEEVYDPEVPVLSVVDLGVVRSVEPIGEGVIVTITPTYIGCPAMQTIENETPREWNIKFDDSNLYFTCLDHGLDV